jgi:serralysin
MLIVEGPMVTTRGTYGNDSLSGGLDDDVLLGLSGDDTVDGSQGQDLLDGGSGNDSLDGGAGADTLYAGTGEDTLIGGNGDHLEGSDGEDLLVVGTEYGGLILTAGGGSDNDTFISLKADNLPSELDLNYDLSLSGDDGDDAFTFTFGALEESTLEGGCGNDHFEIRTMLGGVLNGDEGHDRIEVRNVRGHISGGDGNDVISIGAGQATDTFLSGGDGDDVIAALAGSSFISGGAGHDQLSDGFEPLGPASELSGDTGDDQLSSLGRDILLGGDGADSLDSGAYENTLTGGAGGDRFVYGDLVRLDAIFSDTITDFDKDGGDILDVSRLLERVGSPADPFASGWLELSIASGNTSVLFDADGGGDDLRVLTTLENTILDESDLVIGSDPLLPCLDD